MKKCKEEKKKKDEKRNERKEKKVRCETATLKGEVKAKS